MTTTYLGRAVLDQLAEAQRVIDRHIVSCAVCGSSTACMVRNEAEAVFARYGRLPRRTPFLTGAGLNNGQGFGWLTA